MDTINLLPESDFIGSLLHAFSNVETCQQCSVGIYEKLKVPI
jgi:hypothetical protein